MPEKRRIALVGSIGGGVGFPRFKPRTRRVVAFSGRNVVQEWTVRVDDTPHAAIATQRPQSGNVVAVAYDKDGDLLLSADDTDTVSVWKSQRESQETVRIHAGGHLIADAGFTLDGRIITAGADGSARLWRVPPGLDASEKVPPVCKGCASAADWIAAAERKRTRVLTPEERKRYGFAPDAGPAPIRPAADRRNSR